MQEKTSKNKKINLKLKKIIFLLAQPEENSHSLKNSIKNFTHTHSALLFMGKNVAFLLNNNRKTKIFKEKSFIDKKCNKK